jgi:hypothetical protein
MTGRERDSQFAIAESPSGMNVNASAGAATTAALMRGS